MRRSEWRRRMAIAHRMMDRLLAGERVWLFVDRGRIYPYASLDRPGRLVYGVDWRTGLFAVRYRIIGGDGHAH